MKLAIKKEEALATLKCEGVEVGATLDLMAAEEYVIPFPLVSYQ